MIKENLQRVEEGKALDMPLAVLDGNFKKAYQKVTDKLVHREYYLQGKYRYPYNPEKQRAYYLKNRKKILARMKAYSKTEGYKKSIRKYHIRNREKLNAKSRKYYAGHREYWRNYYKRRKKL